MFVKNFQARILKIISCSQFMFLILTYFIDYAITVVPYFCPLYSPLPCTPLPPSFPQLSSCPWVVRVSSLASPFPILFLSYPYLFCTYHLCFLFPVAFLPFCPFPLPTDNPLNDLHLYDSVPVRVICLVHFCFCFLDSK